MRALLCNPPVPYPTNGTLTFQSVLILSLLNSRYFTHFLKL